jgi:hypothetical protein
MENEHRLKSTALATWIAAIANLIMAVAALLAVYVTLRTTEKVLQSGDESTKAVVASLGQIVRANNDSTAKLVTTNQESANLATRAYVAVSLEYPVRCLYTPGSYSYGNRVVLTNTGKTPAANVSTRYFITTDADEGRNHFGEKWFNENYGGVHSVPLIAPEAKEYEPGARDLSGFALYFYLEAVTTYEGLEKGKQYWMHVKKLFFVRNDNTLVPVCGYGDWDRNENFMPPVLSTELEVQRIIGNAQGKLSPARLAEYRRSRPPAPSCESVWKR